LQADSTTQSALSEYGTLQQLDTQRVWHGLLLTAALQFERNDDVSMLLRLMADVPGILQNSSGGQWPVKMMVALLNDRYPSPAWSADRVDNAKRRLMNWIDRLMQTNGVDATDLEGLFARIARRQEGGECVSLTDLRHPNLAH